MFDIAWSEMLVIVVVALLVIGPKDLPRVIREVGRWTAKARAMAREFQRSFDDMVRDAELDDIRKNLDQVRPSNITKTIRDAVDPDGHLDNPFTMDELERSRRPPPEAESNPNGTPKPAAAATHEGMPVGQIPGITPPDQPASPTPPQEVPPGHAGAAAVDSPRGPAAESPTPLPAMPRDQAARESVSS